MIKRFILIALVIIIQLNSNLVFAHILHYQKLNKLEFDLYRNNKLIGKHIYLFKRYGENLTVESKVDFVIKKLGITFYEYFAHGVEKYINGEFHSFSAKTNQNKKEKFCNMYRKDNKFYTDGSSYRGFAPEGFIIGTWWNHEIIDSKSQISAVSGRIIEQNVKFLGKETIKINNIEYNSLKFNFSSSDPSLAKGKKLNTNVWYDEEELIWLKTTFEKSGYWEYRLISVY